MKDTFLLPERNMELFERIKCIEIQKRESHKSLLVSGTSIDVFLCFTFIFYVVSVAAWLENVAF